MIELIVYNETVECRDVPTGGPVYPECGNEDGKEPVYTQTGNVSLDLSNSTVISLNKDIMELRDITKQSGEFTYDFIAPASDKNRTFFKNFGILNWVTGITYKSYRASLVKDGVTVFNGRLILVAYDQNKSEYKLRLFGNLGYLIYKLKDRKVRDLSYFDRFIHRYEGHATIVDSWTGDLKRGSVPDTIGECRDANGNIVACSTNHKVQMNKEFLYPLQDLQGMGYFHNENIQDNGTEKYVPFHTPIVGDESKSDVIKTPFDASILTPAVKLMPVIKAIFDEAGFKASLDFFRGTENWEFLYLQLPQLKGDFRKPEDSLKAKARKTTTDTYYPNGEAMDVSFDMTPEFGNLFMHENKFVAPVAGDYTFRIHYDFARAGRDEGFGSTHMLLHNITKTERILASPLAYVNMRRIGDDQATVTLDAGDEVMYINRCVPVPGQIWGVTVYDTNYFEVIDGPSVPYDLVRNIGDYFGDLTQIDLLKEWMSLSNAVIDYPDRADEGYISVKPLLNRWTDTDIVQMDITDKIDRTGKFEVRPSIELMPQTVQFSFKDSDDVLNSAYKATIGVNYGDTAKITTGMQYAGSNMVIKSKLLSPFTTGAVRLKEARDNSHDSEIVIPLAFKDVNKFDKVDDRFQLFLWNGHKRNLTHDTFYIKDYAESDNIGTANYYPMCHNMLLKAGKAYKYDKDTPDSNWDYAAPYSVEPINPADPVTSVGNNWFDNYYRGYIDSLYSEDTVIIETGLKLTPKEFKDLNLFAPVLLDGSRYRFLSYKDYDIMGDKPMKVTLLKDTIKVGRLAAPPSTGTVNMDVEYPVTFDNAQKVTVHATEGTTESITAEVNNDWYLVGDEPVEYTINYSFSQNLGTDITVTVNGVTSASTIGEITDGYLFYDDEYLMIYVYRKSNQFSKLRYKIKKYNGDRTDSVTVSSADTAITSTIKLKEAEPMFVDARYHEIYDGPLVEHIATERGDYSQTSKLYVSPTMTDKFITDVNFRDNKGFDWETRKLKVAYKGQNIIKTIKAWSQDTMTHHTLDDIYIYCKEANTRHIQMYAYATGDNETSVETIRFSIQGSGITYYRCHFDSKYSQLTVLNVVAVYEGGKLKGSWDAVPGATKYRYAVAENGGSYPPPTETTNTNFEQVVDTDYWGKSYLFYVDAFDGTSWSESHSYSNIVTAQPDQIPAPTLSDPTSKTVKVTLDVPGDEWHFRLGGQNPPTDGDVVLLTKPNNAELSYEKTGSGTTLYVYARVLKEGSAKWSDFGAVAQITVPNVSVPTGLTARTAQDIRRVYFDWDDNPNIDGWDIQLGINEEPTGNIRSISGNSWFQTNINSGDTVKAKVRERKGTETSAWTSVVGVTMP